MIRIVLLVTCVCLGCGNKKASTSSGSAAGSAAGQTVGDAMAIVCNVLERAKLSAEDEKALADATTSVDIAKLSGRRESLADDIVDREVTNAEVLATWNSDAGGNRAQQWADLMANANMTSCAYLDWRTSIKDRMMAANAAGGGSGSAR
jgi:hypothetical protein